MKSNVSTVKFQSNLYPVTEYFSDDKFRSKIHDIFALKSLKNLYGLTTFQEEEYSLASPH